MSITVYGYILIPLLIIIFLIKPKYLIYLLIVSLTLQVTSLINIGDYYSLQIYRFITILVSVRFFIHLTMREFKIKFKNKILKEISLYGIVFAFFAMIWSFIAPFIFAGYPVFPPELGIDFSAIYGPSPLKFSEYNIALSIYILFYVLTLLFIITTNWDQNDLKILYRIFMISFLIILVTSISQILNFILKTPDITTYLYTITTREFELSIAGSFPRVQATYQEPSMFAPFIVGVYSYYLYSTFKYKNLLHLIMTIVALILILLSASTTAYISTMILTLLVLYFNLPLRIKNYTVYISLSRIIINVIVITAMLLISMGIIFFTIGFDSFIFLINEFLINKSDSESYKNRMIADLHALKLFVDTYGFGVGLGSNRPSSLLPFLLSQLGFVGTWLFLVFIYKIMYFTYKSLKNTEYFQYFFLIPAVLVSQLIAYPDITNPTLWQFIYICIIFSSIFSRRFQNNESLS